MDIEKVNGKSAKETPKPKRSERIRNLSARQKKQKELFGYSDDFIVPDAIRGRTHSDCSKVDQRDRARKRRKDNKTKEDYLDSESADESRQEKKRAKSLTRSQQRIDLLFGRDPRQGMIDTCQQEDYFVGAQIDNSNPSAALSVAVNADQLGSCIVPFHRDKQVVNVSSKHTIGVSMLDGDQGNHVDGDGLLS